MQWIKIYSGTATDPKFRLIAKDAGTSISEALAIWLLILEKAGEADGDATGFNPRLADVALDLTEGSAAKIIVAMQDIGMLNGMFVTAWQKRQSAKRTDRQPLSNAERQRKFREARRNEAVTQSNESVTERNVTVTQSNVTSNESVTERNESVTRLKDKNREEEIKNLNINTAPQGDADHLPAEIPKAHKSGKKAAPPDEPHYQGKSGRYLTGKRLTSFMQFWNAFDYRKGKAEAADAWLDIPALSDEFVERICNAARQEASGRPQLEQKGHTPKMAQGWINSKRWEDYEPAPEVESAAKVRTLADVTAAMADEKIDETEWQKAQEMRRKLADERSRVAI